MMTMNVTLSWVKISLIEYLNEALWVTKREHQTYPRATTWLDLQLHLAGVDAASIGMEDHDDPDDIPLSQFVAGMQETSVMSIAGNRLKKKLLRRVHIREMLMVSLLNHMISVKR